MMSGLSTTNDLPNVAAYGPDWCQLGFVQGATGALVSTSGIIGGVGAIEIFPAQLTIEGLNLGAETAKSGTQVALGSASSADNEIDSPHLTRQLPRSLARRLARLTQGTVARLAGSVVGRMERFGLVGLPNAGKSSLYNALTGGGALAAPYAFATKDPNIGVAKVPDERLDRLAAMSKSRNVVHAAVEVVDIGGLVEGAQQG